MGHIYIDFENNHCSTGPHIVACIIRDKKDKVVYSSGLIYFNHVKPMMKFKHKIVKADKRIKVFDIDIKNAVRPSEIIHRGYWCPYCRSWEYWSTDAGGYKRCPICGVGDSEYYVKMFNGLWGNKMESSSSKRKVDKMKKGGNKK